MFNNFQHGSHLWLVRVEAESFLSDGRPVYRTIPGSLTHSSLAVSHDHQFSNKVFWGICVTLKQKDIRVKYTHRSLLCLTIMPVMGKHPCVCTYDQLCVLTVSKSWVSLFLFSHRSVHPGQERMLHISPQIGSQHLSTSRLQSHISLDTYFFFFLQMSRIKCTSQLWGPVSQTQMTGKVLLLTPVLVSWGPALIHFCLWALARNHADKSMGCPLIGQMFFSTGACRVGKNSKLAGLTCQPIFLSLGNSVKVAKYLEFRTQVNTSFNTR